jgi:hypothetical protein
LGGLGASMTFQVGWGQAGPPVFLAEPPKQIATGPFTRFRVMITGLSAKKSMFKVHWSEYRELPKTTLKMAP